MNKKIHISFLTLGIMALFIIIHIPTALAQATTTDGSNEPVSTRSQYVRGWRGQSSELQQKINALPSNKEQSIAIPVLFGVELHNLSSSFGDPRSNGRTHIGADIMAVQGTPIISPTQAVVLRTGVGSGEGNYVYTANPGGETFVYMHLDTFGEGVIAGTVLQKGSIIGYVGNTGNASGGAAHLHFEIHDSIGTAIDPFPRITQSLTLEEKIQYLTSILTASRDSNTLAQLLVLNFRSAFKQAASSGVALPQIIINYMASTPDVQPPASSGSSLPAGDLALGSKGSEVVALQQYLIAKNKGPNAVRLSQAGATGNFGALTQSALMEYQTSVGIVPADGYYGQVTRASVAANPVGQVTPSPTPITPTPTNGTLVLTRDLTINSTGEDVRALQRFLNNNEYLVSYMGAGSMGNETTYFGPATLSAVIRFQTSKMISPAAGYVGPITKKAISSMNN